MGTREDIRVFLGLARIELRVAARPALIASIILAFAAFVCSFCASLDWDKIMENPQQADQARIEIFSSDYGHQVSEVPITWSARSGALRVNRSAKSLVANVSDFVAAVLKFLETPGPQSDTASRGDGGFFNIEKPPWRWGYQGQNDSDPSVNQLTSNGGIGSWTLVEPGSEANFFRLAGMGKGSAIFFIPKNSRNESLRVHIYEPDEQNPDDRMAMELAILNILDNRAKDMFAQRSMELGLPSSAFIFPSVKVTADRSIETSSAISSPHVALDAAQAKKVHRRTATLTLWVLAIDIGGLCGAVYLSVWTKRHAEGGFEIYAKSPHSAWAMCAAQPAAMAFLHWAPLVVGAALGWAAAFGFGEGSTMVSLLNIVLCIVAMGCSSIMSTLVELVALSISSNPIMRRWLSMLPIFILGLINLGGLWDFSEGSFHSNVDGLDPQTAITTMVAMLLIGAFSLWIAHVRIGRFCRDSWQNKPKH